MEEEIWTFEPFGDKWIAVEEATNSMLVAPSKSELQEIILELQQEDRTGTCGE